MKFYLTGGAVRDELLGNTVRDKDYIILDANKDELLKMRFEPVGKDFEVYLHPKTKDEYTLAFENDLYKELERRDLTVNSIAKDIQTGEYYDPFHGIEDIQKKVLKHTSIFFSDDPIRLLRIARFACQYPDFEIHRDTLELCRTLSINSDLFDSITGERYLLELKKALTLSNPRLFFERLREWGTLNLFFPELAQLWGVPQKQNFYPEGDRWIHTMLVLEKVCQLSQDFSVRFAALVLNLGMDDISSIKNISNRFKLDNYTKKLAVTVCKNHLNVDRVLELKASTILKLLVDFNALREGRLFEDALVCCYAVAVRTGNKYRQKDFLLKLAIELKNLSLNDLLGKYKGDKLGEMIKLKRIMLIEEVKKSVLE